MKQCRLIILLFVLMLGVVGCTQNRGNIGDLFGSWVLEEMTADGNTLPLPDNAEYATIAFQGTVVRYTLHFGLHIYTNRVSTWTRSDNILSFDFTNGGHEIETDGTFAPPYWLYFDEEIVTFVIAQLDKGHLTLVRNSKDGKTYVYKYLRTW